MKSCQEKLKISREYRAAKRNYEESKPKGRNRSKNATIQFAKAKINNIEPTKSPPYLKKNIELNNQPLNVDSSYELLELTRPNQNIYGLEELKDIESRIAESIKLCGLRKIRENSILDGVSLLCNISSKCREENMTWVNFADHVVVVAAEKLAKSSQNNEKLSNSIKEYHKDINNMQESIRKLKMKFVSTREEFKKVIEAAKSILTLAPCINKKYKEFLKSELSIQYDSFKSESKSDVCDAFERLSIIHNNEKRNLESTITALRNLVRQEKIKSESLKSQLYSIKQDLQREIKARESSCMDFNSDLEKFQNIAMEANKKINSLQAILKAEKIGRKKDIDRLEEKRLIEMDKIDTKVKKTLEALTKAKDEEIERAMKRAQIAETSAVATEQILKELNSKLAPILSTAEPSNER